MGLETLLMAGQGVGMGMQIGGIRAQAGQEAAWQAANAAILRDQARQVGELLKVELGQLQRKGRAFMGTQIATAGKSGFGLQGSTMEILDETARELARQEAILGQKRITQRQHLLAQSQIEGLMGKARKKAAGYDVAGALAKGTTQLGLQGHEYGMW